MKTIATLTTLLCMLATSLFAEEAKPLKALMITGGGYHDYKNQKKIIAEGVSARANVEWTVVLENPTYHLSLATLTSTEQTSPLRTTLKYVFKLGNFWSQSSITCCGWLR